MGRVTLIDAGPALNFFAINKERLLIDVVGALTVPETVVGEVLRKAQRDPRFAAAEVVVKKLPKRLFNVVSDSPEDDRLTRAVERVMAYEHASEASFKERKSRSKNLGELMVLAHASLRAEQGETVIILIDDGDGQRNVMKEIERIRRLRLAGRTVLGAISMITTVTVLERAAISRHIPDKHAMREIYQRLRRLDDDLQPIENTDLLTEKIWSGCS